MQKRTGGASLLKKPIRLVILAVVPAALVISFRSNVIGSMVQHIRGMKTIDDRVAQYGPQVYVRLVPFFQKQGVAYPPSSLTLLGLKKERRLEIYAAGPDKQMRFIRFYPILGASGTLGPKRQEGDGQVPEGIYAIDSLNPNSLYHLSLRVGYPNAFDRAQAEKEGRTDLGGDIMIHGHTGSVGCLAMGDEAAEDLFVLAADTGPQNIKVVLSPLDFRQGKTPPAEPNMPSWTPELYHQIKQELAQLPKAG